MLALRCRRIAGSSRWASTSAKSGPSSASVTSSLIAAAQVHIPYHGFTVAAVDAALASSESSIDADVKRSLNEWNLGRLFPGSSTQESGIPIRLFRHWDQEQWRKVAASYAPATPHDKGTGSTQDAVEVLVKRLRGSDEVKRHLIEPFALITAAQLPLSLGSFLPKSLPIVPILLPDSIPNPLPLLTRAAAIADSSCAISRLDTSFGPEWYGVRAKLAAAYLAAELHLISQAGEVTASEAVLRSVANAPVTGPALATSAASAILGGLFSKPAASKSWPTARSKPWPTQAGFATSRRTFSSFRPHATPASQMLASSRRYSTLPNQSQVVDTFATPFQHFVLICSRIARIITLTILGTALLVFAVFEGTHLYAEHISMKAPRSGASDTFGWQSEADDDSWSSEGGTDRRLGFLGRHILRSAWMCVHWGSGIDPELFFSSTSGPAGEAVNPVQFASRNSQGDGLSLAATFLKGAVDIAEKRGIQLPDIEAVRLGLKTAHEAHLDGPLDKTAVALETRLAAIRERLGDSDSVALAIAGYERIFDALEASEETRESVGNAGRAVVPVSKLIRLATKLGNLNSYAGKRREAEAWLLKAISLSKDSLPHAQLALSDLPSEVREIAKSESEGASSHWLGGWFGRKAEPLVSPAEEQRPAAPDVHLQDAGPGASLSRSVASALLSLSGFYASPRSPEEASPSHPVRQSDLLKALSVQTLLRQHLQSTLASARADSTVTSSRVGKTLHEAWLQHALAVGKVHMAETLYALNSDKSQAKKARAVLSSHGLDGSADGGNLSAGGSISSARLLEEAAQRAKLAHDELAVKRSGASKGKKAEFSLSGSSVGGLESLLPLSDVKESFRREGTAYEMPAARLVRDTRRVREQCERMLKILSKQGA